MLIMIECKVSDYLTCSLLPGEVTCSIRELVDKLLEAFMLEDTLELFRPVAQNFMYETIMRFGDIQLKIPYSYNYKKQGVCIEFSGQGLDYYREYLSTHRSGADLRFAARRFIGLAKYGFKTKCSRFDVAFDEKHNNGDSEPQLLDLDVIKDTLKSRHFVTKFTKGDPVNQSEKLESIVFTVDIGKIDKKLPCRFIESENLSTGRIGKTIELGRRKSNSFVRFYDKLAEQEAHKFEVPPELHSWVRFEIEFKGSRANSVFFAYAKFDNDRDFANYMRSVALGIIRFIEPDHSRKYNCTTCSWWYEFLCNAKSARLVYNKPKYNKYVRSRESAIRQNAATFTALLMCDIGNLKSFISYGTKKLSKSARAILSDYRAIQFLDSEEYERVYKESTTPETGYDFWKRHAYLSSATDEEFEEFMSQCADDMCREVEKILDAKAIAL